MVDNEQFIRSLDIALDRQRDYLDSKRLPMAKETFESLRGTFENFYNVLLKKSLIKEDPYKAEQKISEVEQPSNDPVSESEKADQISIRLSHFDNQLTFLKTYYQFSVDYLSLKRIKLLMGLTNFVHWENLSPTSAHTNTRLVGELVNKIRAGTDTFAVQVVNDAQNQLSKFGDDIAAMLKELTRYHRERYKLEVRSTVTFQMDISPEIVQSDKKGALDMVKKRFSTSMHGVPFYGELIEEILEEDFGVNSDTLQKNVLKSLEVTQEKKQKQKKVDYRGYILESLRVLSVAAKPIEQALLKLEEGSSIVEEYRQREDGPLKRFIYRIFSKGKAARIYEVEFVDPVTSAERTMPINFDDFSKRGAVTAKSVAGFSSKGGAGNAKIAHLSDDALYELLERLATEVQRLTRTMPTLHSYFQSELDKLGKGKLRGIRLEINAIKNAMLKANQRRHEYVSRREEREQLKRLGIGS